MIITTENVAAAKPVTVMGLRGELDAASYLDVIEQVKGLYRDGTRDLLLDFGELRFMASSGLVALHSIALVMRGAEAPDPEAGWAELHEIPMFLKRTVGHEAHVKILNPRPRVQKTLETTGFDQILDVFMDRGAALAAF